MRGFFISIISSLAFMIFSVALLASNAYSEVRYVLPEGKPKLAGQALNIHFWGGVNQAKIVDLLSAIDNFNIDYPQAKTINLYINSGGGDMDAGWAGYMAIKSSRIPVRTINVATTDSAATLLYCASPERYVVNGATFLLHPAAIRFDSGDYKPDVLNRKIEYLKNLNHYFLKAYGECTNLDEKDIQQLLTAENFSKSVDDDEAVKIGLASKILTVEFPGAASAYIFDPEKE
jgi:ATP-dependent Clp protease, protease subunit